jgi:hypothetical protein
MGAKRQGCNGLNSMQFRIYEKNIDELHLMAPSELERFALSILLAPYI